MTSKQSRLEAYGRLPLKPSGSAVVTDNPNVYLAMGGGIVVAVVFGPLLLVGGVPSLEVVLSALVGIPLSWLLRRCYQWLPTGQAVTVLIDPDG